jgi:hypothetical protein
MRIRAVLAMRLKSRRRRQRAREVAHKRGTKRVAISVRDAAVYGDWSEWTSDAEAHRRAGGRRAYNNWRQSMALYRRMRLMEIVARNHLNLWSRNGAQKMLAGALGVSKSTVSRDIKAILSEYRPGKPCPLCRCEVRHIWRGTPMWQVLHQDE